MLIFALFCYGRCEEIQAHFNCQVKSGTALELQIPRHKSGKYLDLTVNQPQYFLFPLSYNYGWVKYFITHAYVLKQLQVVKSVMHVIHIHVNY